MSTFQVGLRSITTEGREQGKRFGVEQFEMRTFSRDREFLENLVSLSFFVFYSPNSFWFFLELLCSSFNYVYPCHSYVYIQIYRYVLRCVEIHFSGSIFKFCTSIRKPVNLWNKKNLWCETVKMFFIDKSGNLLCNRHISFMCCVCGQSVWI